MKHALLAKHALEILRNGVSTEYSNIEYLCNLRHRLPVQPQPSSTCATLGIECFFNLRHLRHRIPVQPPWDAIGLPCQVK